jgi:DNA-binding response OmpR family regulator
MVHVLIADDSPVVRAALEKKLSKAGATITLAASAAEAAAVDPTSIDAALLDLDLGDGSGVDVAIVLRTRRPDLRLAFFSAVDDVGHRERAAALGTVFAKPEGVDEAVAWLTRT